MARYEARSISFGFLIQISNLNLSLTFSYCFCEIHIMLPSVRRNVNVLGLIDYRGRALNTDRPRIQAGGLT